MRNLRTGEAIFVHDAKYLYRVQSESSSSFRQRLKSKYTLEGFAEVCEGDVVVDCGAHVGGFSLAAAEDANHVYAVEPDPRLQKALSLTFEKYLNISLHKVALSDESGEVIFRLSNNPSENSMIDVDSGIETNRVIITSMTVEEFVESTERQSVDILKADAEGAEPEVLRGIGDLRPRVIAMDTGPERHGNRTTAEIRSLLSDFGYETKLKNDVVFGRYRN